MPNTVLAPFGTIAGGWSNTAGGSSSAIGGGFSNSGGGANSAVVGGLSNTADGNYAAVGGGESNSAGATWATAGGGESNTASAAHATVSGGESNTAGEGAATVGGGFSNEASGSNSTVGGGSGNHASGPGSTVGGGGGNTAGGFEATAAGGSGNDASGDRSTVPGGFQNESRGDYSMAAGFRARAAHQGTFVWNDNSTFIGPDSLVSTGPYQFLIKAVGGVGIGTNSPTNELSVEGSVDITDTLGVGTSNPATPFALNAGLGGEDVGITQGQIGLEHTMELTTTDTDGDQTTRLLFRGNNDVADVEFYRGAFESEILTLFIEGVNGRVGLGTNSPGFPLVVGTDGTNGNGAYVTAGGTWTSTSSRSLKEDLRPVDPDVILDRIADIPLYRWKYKDSDEGDHLGPVAEDFFAAFELGGSAQHIAAVDGDGVALAAIQGLYRMMLRQQKEIESLRSTLEEDCLGR